jgi:uncharacterized SAM-binding protein YcdF (DUF218 family)
MYKLIFSILGIAFGSWVLIHSLIITIQGLAATARRSDCIIVLGNTVNPDGTLSHRLQSRVDKGLELYQQKIAPKIVVSGGLGKEGYYEAREMKKYLLAHGVPEVDIIAEDQALTTYQTMCYYQPIAQAHRFESAVLVSQFFHLARSKKMLESKGVTQVSMAASDYFEWRDIYAVAREFVAYYGFLIAPPRCPSNTSIPPNL